MATFGRRAGANHLRDKRKVELSGRISRDSNEEIATYGKQIVGILKEADSALQSMRFGQAWDELDHCCWNSLCKAHSSEQTWLAVPCSISIVV